MTVHIAFLRAVNVGKRTVSMATLAGVVEDLGYDDVWTYINSGNVVFRRKRGAEAIEEQLEARLEAELGFVVETFVRTAKELRAVGDATPFPVSAEHTHMVTFFRDRATAAQTAVLEGLSNDVDTLVVAGREVHWRIVGTVMTSELRPKDWTSTGIGPSTSRNMNGLRKLIARLP